MNITTRSRYATRALLEIATQPANRPVGLRSIAERQEIPAKYLESLFRQVKAAGLIKSVRGASGGYVLCRPSRHISVWDVVSAVEGNLAIVECGDGPHACHRSSHCVTRDLWHRLDRSVTDMLASVSLADLAEDLRLKQQRAIDFVI